MRRFDLRSVTFLVLLSAAAVGSVADAQERRSLTLLVTSGTGGKLEAEDGRTAAELASTVRALAHEARAVGRDVLILDAGRTVAPYAESRFDGGRAMIELLAAAGVEVWTPSSMDLSTAGDRLHLLAERHGIQVVLPFASPDGAPPEAFVSDLGGGLRVAVVGLMAADELEDAAQAGRPTPVESAAALAEVDRALRVAVVHSGGHGADLTSRVLTWRLVESPGPVDLILDPDLGAGLELRRHVDGRDVVLVGRDRDLHDPWTVARIRLELEGADGGWRIADVAVDEVPSSRREPGLPALDEALRTHMASFRESAGRALPAGAPGDRDELERFVVEAMRERARAEIAVVNRGALRPVAAEHMAGPELTVEAVLRMLSLPQELVLVRLAGADIRSLVEDAASRRDAHGRLQSDALRFAGLSWSLDGGDVDEIEVNGRPLRDGDRYRVATTRYLIDGGDGYPPLADATLHPLPGGQQSVPLRDGVVMPRLEDAAREFPDLDRSPVWRYAVSRVGLGLDGVVTDRSAAYDDVSDSRASAVDSTSLRGDLTAFATREMPSWRWENLLQVRYAMIETSGENLEELDDDVRFDTSAVFTRATVLRGASPYASAILDTELRPGRSDDGERLPRQLEESVSAGLTWQTDHWPRLRIGGVLRRYGNVDRDDQHGFLGEAIYRLEPDDGRRRFGLEGRLYAEALRGGGSEVRRFDLGLRLLVPAFGDLLLSPEVNWYLYDDSTLEGEARYLRYSVSLAWSWKGRSQRR